MSKTLKIWLSIIGAIVILVIGFVIFQVTQAQAAQEIVDNADTRSIKAVMAQAYDVIAKAAQTYDVSEFSTVFVDTSDYKLTTEQLKALTGILGISATKNAGYLTAMQADYMAMGQGATLLQAAVDKAKAQNREITAAEFQAVIQANHGQVPPASVINAKTTLTYDSIKVNGDKAVVRYDDGAALQEAILVRINGKWFIAGITPINIHY